MQIGFIGLGYIGESIARRLARSGFSVTGCDVSPQALEAFDEPGTRRERDPVQAAQGAQMLGICVRNDAQVETLTADGALFAALGVGGVFILHSTVAPDLARRLARQAEQYGVAVIDTGVSGGPPVALEGKLGLFVGGDSAAVEKAKPYLNVLGTVSHLGPVGRGLEAKLLNNLVSFANYGMSAAILDLGVKQGFDWQVLSQALMNASAQSFALKVVPGMIGWQGNATAEWLENLHELIAKDVVHCEVLAPADDPAMSALLAASRALLARIKRAAAEARS